ncbi:UDP-N-acetylglucosamine 1-carboxyvinyltransferase [candidate division KSB1 bacterium]|nr:UDP-N-acetylglucosamine 1-carboxyvinyltransferase [candidate division KSB1 bacterium]
MDKIVILGGKNLKGVVEISGSKNAVLPIMACALLAEGQYHLKSVPHLRDVRTMVKLLNSIGLTVQFNENEVHIESGHVAHYEAPYDLVKTMRASIYVLGPMLSRFGEAKVSLPGGCAWGPRPVNLHIQGLEQLGAKITIENGYIHAKAKRLKGARILFNMPSVGATGNLLMAAVLAKGTTVLENAAQEPEITALAEFLVQMGARIDGIGTSHLEIEGVDSLRPASTAIIPDRIEAGTFLAVGHIVGGDILIKNVIPDHVSKITEKLIEAGAEITEDSDQIHIKSNGVSKPVDIATAVFPGFPTDMQAQWMALMSTAKGSSVITENIYLDRFTHVAELQRLGADIRLDHNVALVKGVKNLNGAPVMSTDLRASASLIMAGLIAKGRTDISRVYHIDRGYEQIEAKLKNLGAEIWREKEPLVT